MSAPLDKTPMDKAIEQGIDLTTEQLLNQRIMRLQFEQMTHEQLIDNLEQAALSLMYYQNLIKAVMKNAPEMLQTHMMQSKRK